MAKLKDRIPIHEPYKAREAIIKEYWVCEHPDHRHQTQAVAIKCWRRTSKSRAKPTLTRKELNRRNLAIVEMLLKGATLKEAGKGFGLSPSRVREICIQYYRILRADKSRWSWPKPYVYPNGKTGVQGILGEEAKHKRPFSMQFREKKIAPEAAGTRSHVHVLWRPGLAYELSIRRTSDGKE